jgi:hypothetical protein
MTDDLYAYLAKIANRNTRPCVEGEHAWQIGEAKQFIPGRNMHVVTCGKCKAVLQIVDEREYSGTIVQTVKGGKL